jgi:hypothetical protein
MAMMVMMMMVVTEQRLGYKYDVYPKSNHLHKVYKGFKISKVAATIHRLFCFTLCPIRPLLFLFRSTDEVVNSLVSPFSAIGWSLKPIKYYKL